MGADHKEVSAIVDFKKYIRNVLYRPFDVRRIIYHSSMIDWPRENIMRNMFMDNNVGICICRQTVEDRWQHVLASNTIIDDCYVSNMTRERGYLLPRFIYQDGSRSVNINSKFIDYVQTSIDLKYSFPAQDNLHGIFAPEDVLSYIYAILHSPSYRYRYREFLKYDFPRIPVTKNKLLFRELCCKGHNLLNLHLMKVNLIPVTDFKGIGTNKIDRLIFEMDSNQQNGILFVNDSQYFEGFPSNVWEFKVGSYQICNKWLKDRKGRVLSQSDLEHYQQIVAILSATISLMDNIDEVIELHGGWPLD